MLYPGKTIVVEAWDTCDVEGCDAEVDAYIFPTPGMLNPGKYCNEHYLVKKNAE